MSFEAMAWAVKQDLPVKQKITLLMLANRINSDTGRCFPSVKGLAADCGMSETSVKEALRSLKEAGLIVAHERRIDGVSLSNEYEMPIDEIPPPRRNTPHPPAQYAPPPRRNTPPNLSLEPVSEPENVLGGLFSQADVPEAEKKDPDRFDEFWAAYPVKKGKPEARAAWAKAIKKAAPDRIITAAKAYASTKAVIEGYGKFPQGWLNGERWQDDDLAVPVGAKPKSEWTYGEVTR